MAAKKKIIIADDDADILEVTKIILEGYGGYEVVVIDRGDELLKLQAPMPDLILLDLWMSGSNGEEICRQLKNNESTSSIPIIIFSANRELKGIADACGANDYLAKPYQMDGLLEKIASWI
ncbi:response regulator [Flavilitoribacter nigricans]|uniref:Response regulator n=1 Tax=Flavilitoribacter nigricans (strain ATCC 23147 / DSM 23189 / NBRC 102662 / NCIMB 1420 / SS-2) TaxID=1122177 RepID=A0A2D0NG06_FLAN2|nr:response regulator [Flavilitoribacter nigricans]PHN07099.1 response regulator [Flavilitoribacter nigricans DSM 23189 = NBRC 102662]